MSREYQGDSIYNCNMMLINNHIINSFTLKTLRVHNFSRKYPSIFLKNWMPGRHNQPTIKATESLPLSWHNKFEQAFQSCKSDSPLSTKCGNLITLVKIFNKLSRAIAHAHSAFPSETATISIVVITLHHCLSIILRRCLNSLLVE